MKSLELQKQMLLMESELNRAQLTQEWQTIADEIHALTCRAKSLGSIASATAALLAGLSSFRRRKAPPAAEKPVWWETVLKVAGLASSVWSQLRSPVRGPHDE
jgi:hypothetical protein